MATRRGLLKITKLLRDLVLLVSVHEDGPDGSAKATYCEYLVHIIRRFRIIAETDCQHRRVCLYVQKEKLGFHCGIGMKFEIWFIKTRPEYSSFFNIRQEW